MTGGTLTFQNECTQLAYNIRGNSSTSPFEFYWEEARKKLRKNKYPWKQNLKEDEHIKKQTNKKSIIQRLFSYF